MALDVGRDAGPAGEAEPPDADHQKQEEGREAKVHRINADADARDEQADARDVVADERDEATSLAAFLSDHHDYDAALKARQSAAVDRLDAKIDRTSSAQDRSELSDDNLG